jgi:hypothetical protein
VTKIKMPMDPDLYAAAVEVMDAIEEKLLASNMTREDALGKKLAEAYDRWQMLLVGKYAASDDPSGQLDLNNIKPAPRPRWPSLYDPRTPEAAMPEPPPEPPPAVEKRKLHPWRNPPRNPRGKI